MEVQMMRGNLNTPRRCHILEAADVMVILCDQQQGGVGGNGTADDEGQREYSKRRHHGLSTIHCFQQDTLYKWSCGLLVTKHTVNCKIGRLLIIKCNSSLMIHMTTYTKCGMIKQNESKLANIDLEIEPNKENKSFCFLLF